MCLLSLWDSFVGVNLLEGIGWLWRLLECAEQVLAFGTTLLGLQSLGSCDCFHGSCRVASLNSTHILANWGLEG